MIDPRHQPLSVPGLPLDDNPQARFIVGRNYPPVALTLDNDPPCAFLSNSHLIYRVAA